MAKSFGLSVGIVGGGQLARMMVLAGTPLGIKFKVYDPSPDACASAVAPLTCAPFADANAMLAFARDLDALTFDFENVPAPTLQALAHAVNVAPNPAALEIAQDRLFEKRHFSALGIPVAAFRTVDSEADLHQAFAELGPGILKTRTLGYDGKGQVRIKHTDQCGHAYAQLAGSACVYEQLIQFSRELSIVATRSVQGDFRCYPLAQNVHDDGILAVSLVPAPHCAAQTEAAQRYARSVAEAFKYIGTFCLEFFQLPDGSLVLNEMAPRVHNSGHWSIEGSSCSQFENHVRAVAGLPLGDTQALFPSLMLNWIGSLPSADAFIATSRCHWHDYGKGAREGRKVGHTTVTASDLAELHQRIHHLQQISPTRAGELALALLATAS